MKNVGWLLVKKLLNATAHPTTPKLDNAGSHRQPKFYGPFLGLLLTNLLSNSVIAKYAPFGFLRVTYDPVPWVAYNRPSNTDHYQSYNNGWKPINNPVSEYGPPEYITEHPVPEPQQPLSTEPTHVYHHHHYDKPSQQQVINIYDDEHRPTEIIIDDGEEEQEKSNREITTNIEPPHSVEEAAVADESSTPEKRHVKRGIPYRYLGRRRTKPRRKYNTTPDYYYDSYEDVSTIRGKKRRTTPRRPQQDSYEDDDYEYDSFEHTTRPYRKKKKPTQRRKNKYKNKKRPGTTTADYDYDYNAEQVTVGLQPRQETTTFSSTTTTGESTSTTETTPATTITNGSISTSATPMGTGYGYGPSNGNEGVSFTYGPPQNPVRPSYGAPRPSYGPPTHSFYPFSDWRSQHHTRNSVVQKVHNIIGFDDDIQRFRK